MVTDIFRNKSFMQPVRRLNMHPPQALFFPFWGVGWGGGGVIFCISSLFPICSHDVPPICSCVPNSTPILSHMVCPKFNSHVYKLKKAGSRGIHLFLFCNWGSEEVLSLGSVQCSKKIADGPMIMPHFFYKK